MERRTAELKELPGKSEEITELINRTSSAFKYSTQFLAKLGILQTGGHRLPVDRKSQILLVKDHPEEILSLVNVLSWRETIPLIPMK